MQSNSAKVLLMAFTILLNILSTQCEDECLVSKSTGWYSNLEPKFFLDKKFRKFAYDNFYKGEALYTDKIKLRLTCLLYSKYKFTLRK